MLLLIWELAHLGWAYGFKLCFFLDWGDGGDWATVLSSFSMLAHVV